MSDLRVTYNQGVPTIEQKLRKMFLGVIPYDAWTATSTMTLQDAAQAFSARLNPHKFDTDKHIEHAFTFDGVDYYQYSDTLNMTPVRFGYYLLYMKESTINCSREYLLDYVSAIEKSIDSNPVKLRDIAILSKEIRDRLQLTFIPDLIYKEASVLYFDKNENPEVYDFKYNQEKIRKWKEKEAAFFLETPVKNLVVSDAISEENLQTYLMILNLQDKESSKTISSILYPTLSKEVKTSLSELALKADKI